MALENGRSINIIDSKIKHLLRLYLKICLTLEDTCSDKENIAYWPTYTLSKFKDTFMDKNSKYSVASSEKKFVVLVNSRCPGERTGKY